MIRTAAAASPTWFGSNRVDWDNMSYKGVGSTASDVESELSLLGWVVEVVNSSKKRPKAIKVRNDE